MKRLFAAGMILLIIGCSPMQPPIKIGFAASLTGKDSALGIEEREAALMAVEDKNAAGGIDGRRIELVVRDDRNDPEHAVTVDRELVEEENVVAVVGHATSTMTRAALDYINSRDTVFVSPTTSSTYFSGMDDNFIRLEQSIEVECALLAEYALTRGVRRYGGVYDARNEVYTEPWYRYFAEEVVRLGGSTLEPVIFHSETETDYYRLVEGIFADNPDIDGFIIAAGALDTALIAQQVRKFSSSVTLISSGWARTRDLIRAGGGAVEGMLFSLTFDDNSRNPAYIAFRDAFIERYSHRPSFAAAHAYEALFFIFEGLERQKPGQSLKESLLEIERFAGLQGPIVIDRFGDALRPISVLSVRDGEFVLQE